MAAPGDIGTYGFGLGTGTGANREDLLDLITNIDPWDTPFVTQAPKTRANGIVHQWLTETLAATSTAGAIEGDDWTFNTATTRPVRENNICMILRKDIMVSESQRSVNSAGFQDAYQREIAKATREIARNLETILFASQAATSTAAVSGGTATARTLKNFQSFLTASSTAGVMTLTGLLDGGSATAGTLNSAGFNDALQRVYTNGANPEQVYVSPTVKRLISQFTVTNENRNIAAVDKKLVSAVDFWLSDFGVIQVVMDRWIPQSTNVSTASASATDTRGNMFFLTRSMNRIAFLRPVMHSLIGKRGDSVAGMVVGEMTLEVLYPGSNIRVSGVNNRLSGGG